MSAAQSEMDGIIRWLSEAALRGSSLQELFGGFCGKLQESGLPICRGYCGMSTRHPLMEAFDMVWEPGAPKLRQTGFSHSQAERQGWKESPLRQMLLDRQSRMRRKLAGPEATLDFPVLQDLAARGGTDWYGAGTGFEAVSILDSPNALGLVAAWTTDAPGGFAPEHLARLDTFFPVFAVAAKAVTTAEMSRTLLSAYLGADAAERVLSGATHRGSIWRIEAAIFFSDLRDFSVMSEVASNEIVIETLNATFEAIGTAVASHRGQILKFIGDGLLAIFTDQPGSETSACDRALHAAMATLEAVSGLNDKRNGDLPLLQLGIALHRGEVLYGNVGAADRLDFTIIGSAVNEAARMEKLTKRLGHNVLASDTFADGLKTTWDVLAPLGQHKLGAMSRPHSLYALRKFSAL